ncbi:MAG: hypothetical protein KU37_03430 [Sulfuricurvum sp. PC08-66]|nr:MAG: hypothetical protein KU37_03430 [Sulfuricurvum sp. PC08-66]
MKRWLLLFLVATSLWGATQSMSPRTFETLNTINGLLEANQSSQAKQLLTSTIAQTAPQKSYDLAFLYNTQAGLAIQEGNYTHAIASYQTALDFGVLPSSMQTNMRYTMAQLALQLARYAQSLDYLAVWEAENNMTHEAAKLKMVAYLGLEQPKNALIWTDKAIALKSEHDLTLLQNRLALELQLGLDSRAIDTLKLLIEQFEPKRDYYKQLSYLYQKEGQTRKGTAILESAYQIGLLKEYDEILQLAQLLHYDGAPIKAAALLQRATPPIDKAKAHWEYMAQLFLSSRENAKAIKALQTRDALSPEPKTAMLLAQLMAADAQWAGCISYAKRLDTPQGKMLLGTCYAESGERKEAQKIFSSMVEDTRYGKNAKLWLESLRNQE